MLHEPQIWPSARAHLARLRPDHPVIYADPGTLCRTAARFRAGFPGRVTYAVKANPAPWVLGTLAAEGIDAFDVASPDEIAAVRDAAPGAALHYHNPVRSRAEVDAGRAAGVLSWSVDRMTELDKLGMPTPEAEIAVRLKLPLRGAAYDFGDKFGATPDEAVALLGAAQARGWRLSMTFHPGTQCRDASLWARYIEAAAGVARAAGVTLCRLNVGGGFAARRGGAAPDLEATFRTIGDAALARFGASPPALVCEPGRAMVADAVSVALRVKALGPRAATLNDGLYGALAEWRDMGAGAEIEVLAPDGTPRGGPRRPLTVFGPTCDSLDMLRDPLPLPADMQEEDYLLIHGLGAYAQSLTTRFNGYGAQEMVTIAGKAA